MAVSATGETKNIAGDIAKKPAANKPTGAGKRALEKAQLQMQAEKYAKMIEQYKAAQARTTKSQKAIPKAASPAAAGGPRQGKRRSLSKVVPFKQGAASRHRMGAADFMEPEMEHVETEETMMLGSDTGEDKAVDIGNAVVCRRRSIAELGSDMKPNLLASRDTADTRDTGVDTTSNIAGQNYSVKQKSSGTAEGKQKAITLPGVKKLESLSKSYVSNLYIAPVRGR